MAMACNPTVFEQGHCLMEFMVLDKDIMEAFCTGLNTVTPLVFFDWHFVCGDRCTTGPIALLYLGEYPMAKRIFLANSWWLRTAMDAWYKRKYPGVCCPPCSFGLDERRLLPPNTRTSAQVMHTPRLAAVHAEIV